MSTERRVSGDDGTTLMELVIGMVIMVVFMGIFTGSVVLMNRSVTKAEAVTATTTQLNQAFLTLDRTVRYASAISTPGRGTTGNWYVELRTAKTSGNSCWQVRVDIATATVQQRTWIEGGTPAAAFAQVAANVTNGNAASGPTQPFALGVTPSLLGVTPNFQRLAFYLVSASGATNTATTSAFAFTAINSTLPTATNICQGFRP